MGLALLLLGAAPANAPSKADVPREVLSRYLHALQRNHFNAAFALLTRSERAYFKNVSNFASVFQADRFTLDAYDILGVHARAPIGVVFDVRERVRYLDQERQTEARATVGALYGVVDDGGAARVKDMFHPWKAFDPPNESVTRDHLEASIRKISVFAHHIEVVLLFVNHGDVPVTLLPYGRSILRDERGTVYRVIENADPALIDRQLHLGLRLASNAEYLGALRFALPPGGNFSAKSLFLDVAPVMRDGENVPFDLAFPSVVVNGV